MLFPSRVFVTAVEAYKMKSLCERGALRRRPIEWRAVGRGEQAIRRNTNVFIL